MTVRELKQKLDEFDDDMEVCYHDDDTWFTVQAAEGVKSEGTV